MRAYSFNEFIDRPREQVWNVLTNLSVAPLWRPLVSSMQTVGDAPLAVGTDVKIIVDFIGKRSEHVSHTTAFERNVRWMLHSSSSPSMEGWFDFQLTTEGRGTRITATCDLKAHALLNRIFLPLIARGERQRRVEMLPNLKRFVESQ
ncbi:MAG: SRPBCC family protein [Gemmatimonadaceae bacterium]